MRVPAESVSLKTRPPPACHPAAALRRTLAVTITPVTFASAVAAPGHQQRLEPVLREHLLRDYAD